MCLDEFECFFEYLGFFYLFYDIENLNNVFRRISF